MLIFAQLKSLLDVVERDVLQPNNITHVRLDGGVAPKDRFAVVQRFNADPTIDVMLLTTHVGGLGLNLTAADTVIFLEHDWNPSKDMQAMDRAHRLGQARTVNVYRVLTRGTIEERIMGLQRFKMDIAAAVVNTDNMSMDSMDTSQLLDMFQVWGDGFWGGGAKCSIQGPDAKGAKDAGAGKGAGKVGAKAAMEALGALWDEDQYEEYDLQGFAKRIKRE